MSAEQLGRYASALGTISLYHDDGCFWTTGTYTDAVDHVTRRETDVPQDRASAWHWYRLLRSRGAVLAPFPPPPPKRTPVSSEADGAS